MARKSFSFLSLAVGFVLLGFFAVIPKTHAAYEISDGSVAGLYHLEDTADASSNGNDLTNTGSAATTTALFGNGYNINTSGEWLTHSSSLGWTSTGDSFTVAFWLKPNAEISSGEMTLFHLDSSVAGDYNYVGYQYNGGSRRLYYGYNGGNQSYFTSLGTTWHFLVYTRDGSGHRELYVDGISVASNTTAVTYNTGDDQFGLGSDPGSSSNAQTNAIFDEAIVLNRVMTSAEVMALYNGGSGLEVCVTSGCGGGTAIPSISSGTLKQLRSNGVTQINEGSSTDESTVLITAGLQSASTSDPLQLQVEVVTSTFLNTPNVTSTEVMSGDTATTTIAGLPDGSYKWQARVLDTTSDASSSWQRLGSGSTDFVVATPTSTGFEISDGSVVGLYHLENVNDSSRNGHALTNTGSAATATALLGNGYNINASGEWLTTPSNLGWTSTADSFSVAFWFKPNSSLSSGQEMTLFHLDSSDAGDYNYLGYRNDGGSNRLYYGFSGGNVSYYTDLGTSWHYLVYTRSGSSRNLYLDGVSVASNTTGATYNPGGNQFGLASDAVIGTGNANTDAEFDEAMVLNKVLSPSDITALYNNGQGIEACVTVGCNMTILSIGSSTLQQYMSDATTTIGEGSTTLESTVVFGAKLNSTGTSTVQLQVEVKPVGVSFSNIANVTSSSYVASGTYATVTDSNLANASYHWQARAVDGNGASSAWQAFGTNPTSFVVAVPMSAYFDGSNAWAYPASNVEFSATDPWTIEFWYRTTEPTSSVVELVDTRNNGVGYLINRDQDNGIQFYMNCASGSAIDFHAASSTFRLDARDTYDSSGIWHEVAITKSDTTSSINAFSMYLDGVQQTLDVSAGGPILGGCFNDTSTDSIWLGKDATATSTPNYLTGDMDEVKIWDTERSADIYGDMISEASSTDPGLLGLWQFNGTSTDLIMNHAPSTGGSMPFATSSPFGHFLLNQNNYPTSARSDSEYLYASGTINSAYLNAMSFAATTWNAEEGIDIATTTSLANANVVVSQDDGPDDMSYTAVWMPGFSGSPGMITIYSNIDHGISAFTNNEENTFLHELGHSLGLDHSYLGNVMNWYNTDQTSLGYQDAVDFLYLRGQEIWDQ
jgi:hypothetical protein